ncbi:MAG TPA: enoyl-CoA hydratase/isomerase family protein [Acidimicrobiia bacterium]|nr:enoyl-CoA hydratase/isomerase family protein [Acidimicrobiia bacterium]
MLKDPTKDPIADRAGKPYVTLHVDGYVATVSFNRPEKLNAWAWGPTNALCAVAEQLRFDRDVRAVVLRGEGRAFCAGEDLRPETETLEERHAGRSPAEIVRNSYERARLCFERFQVVSELPQPVVVAIQGYCLGAGLELALLGDIRIAGDDATFAFPQATLGLPVVAGADLRMALECGAATTKLLALTGRRFDARTAERIGLVQDVVPVAELDERALAVANEIAANAPIAVQSIKRTINAFVRRGFYEAGLFEAMSSSVAFASDDVTEGMTAFGERRPPRFSGA